MREGDLVSKAEMPVRPAAGGSGTADNEGLDGQARTAREEQPGDKEPTLIQEVLRRENLIKAYKRVVHNSGAPGVDGITVKQLDAQCREHWDEIRIRILSGTYVPQPVRRVEIPKADGKGTRMLGIPTVIDRLIQQALAQVLTPLFEPVFSDSSYGFRPGRRAHDAVRRAQAYINEGYGWVVDIDLEKFFDRVNHDILMDLAAKRVKDKRVLKLLRAFLNAGVMENGLVSPALEGTPQGGPLTPRTQKITSSFPI